MTNDPVKNHALSPDVREASMPAVSKRQRRFMAMCEHGEGKNCPKDMSKKQMRDYARTPETDLPERSMRPHGSGIFTTQDLTQGSKILKESK